MGKQIIVTGGSGYIGSHTIIELLNNTSFDIISVDNYSNSSPATYERVEQITGKPFKTYPIDLCDREAVRKIFLENTGIAGVIHFAAFKAVGESVENPLKYYHNNIASLVNILHCLSEFSVKNFIFSSSCSVYGNITQLPVTEDTPLSKAESPYAHTKQIGEDIIAAFSKVNPHVSSIALRYFNPVGAHETGLNGEDPINKPSNLVPVITLTAIGKIDEMNVHGGDYDTRDGTCIRDYIHVSDIADAHIKALEHLLAGNNIENYSIFNLGSNQGVSVLEAIRAFEKVSGRKLRYKIGPRRSGDVVAIYSDSSKAERALGWKPRRTLEDMMSTAWKWELTRSGNASTMA
jgi:UDP-glucose 4-epimerase